jgi:glycosyltransferase involved in cell wall biosynthesis
VVQKINMFFSVILPTYNREKFLPKAIESVINQSHENWELIIVDDGSTDNTQKLVLEYQKIQKRIKYIYQKNTERSAARNNGIKKAKSDWICFLDSDDLYHESHLEVLYTLIQKNEFKKGLYFSGLSNGSFENSKQYYDTSGNSPLEFVLLNTIGTPRACCYKKILMQNQFNTSLKIGEDKELWSRIALKYPVFYHHKKTFIEIEHENRSINIDDGTENLKTIKLIIKNTVLPKKIKKKLISNAYFNITKNYITKNKKNKALFYLIKSIFKYPKSNKTKHKFFLLISLSTGTNKQVLQAYVDR